MPDYKDEAVGLPGSEDQDYVKPGKPLSKKEAAKAKAELKARAEAALRMKTRKKATGAVESIALFDPLDLIPTGLVKKGAMVVGAVGLRKLVRLLDKAEIVERATKTGSKGYKKLYDVHREWENLSEELARKAHGEGWEKLSATQRFDKVQEVRNASKKAFKEDKIRLTLKTKFPNISKKRLDKLVEKKMSAVKKEAGKRAVKKEAETTTKGKVFTPVDDGLDDLDPVAETAKQWRAKTQRRLDEAVKARKSREPTKEELNQLERAKERARERKLLREHRDTAERRRQAVLKLKEKKDKE